MRVGWVLSGGIEGNSSKTIGFNNHDWLNKNGVDSEILLGQEPGGLDVPQSIKIEIAIQNKEISHLIFQKVCLGKAIDYLSMAKGMGITTIYTVDDYMQGYSRHMEAEADIVVTNSNFMKGLLWREFHREATQIPCAYESDKEFYKKDYQAEQLKVFWFGSLSNARQANDLQNLIKDMGYRYEILGPPSISTIPWKLSYYEDLVQADIVVLPNLRPLTLNEMAKGEGRPVQAMVLGVPVIVSPFPSYIELIQQGRTGLICFSNDLEEWKRYLSYLSDQRVRERIGKAGRDRVVEEYHIDAIGKRWKEILTK